jgi:predicted DsbA family dithiol-disulfide isomerase
MQAVPVVIVSDFSSPFCWLAEAALRRLSGDGRVRVEYHALELFPASTALPDPPEVDLALPIAADLGLELNPPSLAVRTRKAHELTRLARAQGCEDALRDEIFEAYFRDGHDIGRIDALMEIARRVGLDATEARVVLDVDKYAPAIELESARARAAGIVAAPVLLVGGGDHRVRLDGAFPLDELRELIEQNRTNP